MIKLFPISLVVSAGVLLAFASCATEVELSSQEVYEKELAAHVHFVHQDTLQKTESGLYYAQLKSGNGVANFDSAYVLVKETTYDLKYNITASTDENVAHQLGAYSPANHYAPLMLSMGTYSNLMGVEEMLLAMREGDKRRVWLPFWMSAYYEGGSAENSATTVYDLELTKVIPDIKKYEADLLESFRESKYPELDSISKGFYMKKLVEGTGDTIGYGDVVSNLYYIGKFLDGHVFDTNHPDSALFYSITATDLDEGFTMPTLDYIEGTSTSTDDAGTAVMGFSKCLLNMRYGDVAICFFDSDSGYGYSGSESSSSTTSFINGGYSIQPYTPLFFWIYLREDE